MLIAAVEEAPALASTSGRVRTLPLQLFRQNWAISGLFQVYFRSALTGRPQI